MTSSEHACRGKLGIRWRLTSVAALAGGLALGEPGLAVAQTATGDASAPPQEQMQATSGEPSDGVQDAAGSRPARPTPAESDLGTLLSSLATSSRSQQLTADLEAMVQLGDLEPARRLLNEAIEAGTLAALIEGKLERPELLVSLQSMNKPPRQATTPPPMLAAAAGPRVEELEALLDQERQRAAVAVGERDAARAELERHKVEFARRETELHGTVQQAQAELEAAQRDRDAALLQLTALQENEAAVPRLQAMLLRVEERAEAAGQEITALRQRVASLQSENGKLAERAEAAGTESARAEDARAAFEAQRAARMASEEKLAALQSTLAREREQAQATERDLEELKNEAAELRKASIERSELARTLDQERDRAAALLAELNGVKEQNGRLREADAAEVAALKSERNALLAAAADSEELRQALEQEKQRAETLRAQLAAREAPQKDEETGHPADTASIRQGIVGSAGEPDSAFGLSSTDPRPVVSPPPLSDSTRRLLERAKDLVTARDIVGARLLLDRAAQAGSARALFMLAQTHDPQMLRQWRVMGGIVGDEAKARDLYTAARAKGFQAEETALAAE